MKKNNSKIQFLWEGKEEALLQHLTPPSCTYEQPNDIQGNEIHCVDNLDFLKLNQERLRGKVKCIYIDPPYNTGNDFIYKDKRHSKGECKHSKWLSFMYPRLVLARELLQEDGVIFISIDDNEQAYLKVLCDEIFGEENFVNTIIWYYSAMSSKPKNKLRNSAEYILMYSKNNSHFQLNDLKEDKMKNRNIIDIVDKLSKSFHFTKEEAMKNLGYEYDDTEQDWYSWYSQTQKDYFQNSVDSVMYVPVVNRMAKEYVKEFNNQKPVALITKLLKISTKPNSIILDFFAGSGTTGQAVMELNQEEIDKQAKDGLLADKTTEVGGRKFILVQLPEKIDDKKEAFKAGYRHISDITIERVRRAGAKYKGDVGFKVFDCIKKTELLEKYQ